LGERWAAAPAKEKGEGILSLFGTYLEGIFFGAVPAASLANTTKKV